MRLIKIKEDFKDEDKLDFYTRKFIRKNFRKNKELKDEISKYFKRQKKLSKNSFQNPP
ncbi:MAG: hypothetical protein BTN85_2000 [Candidatus Methanohalarchaeum thermophilum]|uniref:Uncharacterized protein n=1 Tax=Methanohalarchaeum thermophilum TaxID=1903181 RepID=A0A1Q6DSJ7_METT1|nr:MAG: hypothetical protein BTN85_2000 [Candidatus Methanohalarchaeum thermophilum]